MKAHWTDTAQDHLDAIHALWAQEAEDRIDAFERGDISAIPAKDVFAETEKSR